MTLSKPDLCPKARSNKKNRSHDWSRCLSIRCDSSWTKEDIEIRFCKRCKLIELDLPTGEVEPYSQDEIIERRIRLKPEE